MVNYPQNEDPELHKRKKRSYRGILTYTNGQVKPYPAESPLYLMKTEMQNIKKFIFALSYLNIQYSQCTNDDYSNGTAFATTSWKLE